jgi:aryl-alcohol dehydrogenase-like predicted oxidoreductase
MEVLMSTLSSSVTHPEAPEHGRTGRSEGLGRRGLLAGSGGLFMGAALGTSSAAASGPQTESLTAQGVTGRRRLGALEVSSIGIGVQNFSRTFQTTVPNRAEMRTIIRTAYEHGVTLFDTAEVYGPLESERILGESIRGFRDDIVVATKFGFNIDYRAETVLPGLNSRPEHIRRAVEGSLRRLRTDRVDLLYQHRVDPTVPIEDVAGAVRALRDEGKVLHWGLSEMGLGTLRRAHAELPVAAVQNEYSVLWQGPEEDGVLDTCEELGIGLVPWSPLGYGFLTGAIDSVTTFSEGDFRSGTSRMDPENRNHNLALVRLLQSWARRKEARPGQIALAWLMAQRPWIVPIPGSTQMPHMLENLGATDVSFTAPELRELNRSIRSFQVRGARLPEAVQAWSGVEAPLPS